MAYLDDENEEENLQRAVELLQIYLPADHPHIIKIQIL